MLAALAVPAAAGPLDADVLAELNRARTDPAGFAATLRDFRRAVSPDGVYHGGGEPPFVLREGTRAVDEAIAFLDRQPPLAPLAANRALAAAARDHTASQGPVGTVGHDDALGGFRARLAAHGVDSEAGETIAYGHATPTAVVVQLIVDDGVATRGHRAVIFTPVFRAAGTACGPHAGYGTMCTIDFAATPPRD
jgi:uncharacterized protein YkwD